MRVDQELWRICCRGLHEQLRTQYAVWPLGSTLQVGDVGTLEDRAVFRRVATLREPYGIEFEIRRDPATVRQYTLMSTAGISIAAAAGVEVAGLKPDMVQGLGPASAQSDIEITFAERAAVFLAAADGRYESVLDQITLGNQIEELFERKEWDGSRAVVIERFVVERLTVFAAAEAGAAVSLRAKGKARPAGVDLASANAGLQIKTSDKIGVDVRASGPLTPLVTLAGIKRKLWGLGRGEFGPRSITRDEVDALLESASLSAAPRDIVYFGEFEWPD